MRPLQGYKAARLSLEELVVAANHFLPDVLPSDISDQRLKEELTPRLVRHYASQGSLEEPLKEGREARYTYRHLLQLLALRRLQAEGHRTGAVAPLTAGMTETELEGLVYGHRQVSLTQATNPALDFLARLRGGSDQPPAGPAVPSAARHHPVVAKETRWVHFKIAPGLKLEVREDFRVPSDPTPLLKEIERALRQSLGHRRSSR